ncbi:MAG: hypothetical protein GX237_10450 [Clostridiales bacterium]|nr:hypothetical protein [Clostridiales bacterium]
MRKRKNPMSYVLAISFVILIVMVFLYLGRWQKENKMKEDSLEKLTEVEKVLALDFEKDFPKTPKEVAKLHGDMTRLLYSGLEDDEVKDLAKKIRELCDEELLNNNPEEQYFNNLYTDLSLWKELGRKIENVFVVNEDKEETKVVDGVQHATAFISFTIVEKGKTSELRRYIMRKNDDGKWKVLGWEHIPQD